MLMGMMIENNYSIIILLYYIIINYSIIIGDERNQLFDQRYFVRNSCSLPCRLKK